MFTIMITRPCSLVITDLLALPWVEMAGMFPSLNIRTKFHILYVTEPSDLEVCTKTENSGDTNSSGKMKIEVSKEEEAVLYFRGNKGLWKRSLHPLRKSRGTFRRCLLLSLCLQGK